MPLTLSASDNLFALTLVYSQGKLHFVPVFPSLFCFHPDIPKSDNGQFETDGTTIPFCEFSM